MKKSLIIVLIILAAGLCARGDILKLKQIDSSEPPLIKVYFDLFLELSEIRKITPDDFKLEEGSQPQKVQEFKKVDQKNSIILMVDLSGSIRRVIPRIRKAVSDYINSAGAADEIMIVGFNSDFMILQDFTGDKDLLRQQLNKIRVDDPWAATALYDSIYKAAEILKQRPGRKSIILLTDGIDANSRDTGPGSERDLDGGLQSALANNIPIYSLGFREKVDKDALRKISQKTGGNQFWIMKEENIEPAYQAISLLQQQEYMIVYTTDNVDPSILERKIKLSLAAGNGKKYTAEKSYNIQGTFPAPKKEPETAAAEPAEKPAVEPAEEKPVEEPAVVAEEPAPEPEPAPAPEPEVTQEAEPEMAAATQPAEPDVTETEQKPEPAAEISPEKKKHKKIKKFFWMLLSAMSAAAF